MKKIKTLLIILLGFLSIAASSSDTLYVRFNNFYVANGAPSDTLIFDVEFKSFTPGTYLTAFQLDIFYSTSAFGSSVVPVVYESLELVGAGMIVTTPPVNPTTNSFRIAKAPFLPPYNTSNFVQVPSANWAGVMRFKMLIADDSFPAGVSFNVAAMTNNQKFILVTGNSMLTYTPIVAWNDLINLPLTLPSLMFSEIGDPDDSGADFVELYNAGATAIDFSLTSAYLTVFDGVTYSNVPLSGSVAAGESFVIGNSGFAAAYPGKTVDQVTEIITGGGDLIHYLSVDGEYLVGTLIDIYDGDAVAYTGMHAVRHFDIDAPNTTFDATEWVVSGAGNMDMTPGSHRTSLTWDGASSTVWSDTANWATSFVPDAGHHAIIPNAGEPIPVISFGNNGYCEDLTIGGSTAGLVIASVDGGGDGSLITYGTVTGSTSVQRFIDADRYYYVTSPVIGAEAGVFLHTWLFTYNETANSWDPFIEPEITPLNNMQGYAVWSSSVNSFNNNFPPIGDTTVAYEGVLNTGSQAKALTFTVDGWNFTGNPYVSALDWEDASWTKTGLASDAYSVWNGATYGTYTVGSGGTNGATQFIPAAQGFFVQANAAGNLGVENDARTHSTQAFWKNQENMLNRLSLSISNGEISDETVIYFNENATTEMDYTYDAAKLIAPAAPQAYTMLGAKMMAINAFNNPGETVSVMMGINAPEAGDYTITASNIESFDAGTPIYLEDLVTKQYVDLRETSSYSFNNEAGTTERFMVHFANTQGIDDPAASEVSSIYASHQDVYVNFNGTRGEISIYNLLGQEISRTVAGNGLNILSVPQGNTVYIVKVVTDHVNVTKKVFVK